MNSAKPWAVEMEQYHRSRKLITVVSSRGIVCRVGDTTMPGAMDDAELIVRAVNAHDDLLSACEFALSIAEGRIDGTWDDVMLEMRRVVALAKVREEDSDAS